MHKEAEIVAISSVTWRVWPAHTYGASHINLFLVFIKGVLHVKWLPSMGLLI